MKIRTITARSAWALALCVVLVPPSLGASEAPGYEQNVPEALRSLVTTSQYDEIYSKLREMRCDVVDEEMILRIISSPCGRSLADLVREYCADPEVRNALNAVVAGLQDPPPVYGFVNPWKAASNGGELLRLLVDDFVDWCIFLPEINGDQDNGLAYIQRFAWFYYQNEAGRDFVRGRNPLRPGQPLKVGLKFVEDFSDQRGKYLWSPASTARIEEWVSDPRIEITDYKKTKAEEYTSWNEFFAREIVVDEKTETIPSRPVTMPKRDYIVVSPTDCIMNPLVQMLIDDLTVTRRYLENPLQYDTVLDVKGIPISVADLLEGVPEKYRKTFVGGTGLSCVLMPNTYHHFHSPVDGTIVHAAVLNQFGTYGYADWPNWVPADGNVGRPGTDFSQFQVFERGVIVIEVKYANLPEGQRPKQEPAELTGYVASIPVGLDTIGSVVLDGDIQPGKQVKRGYSRLGNFYYGGSLNILLFSKGLVTGAVQTRLGNQIGIINVGTPPPDTP